MLNIMRIYFRTKTKKKYNFIYVRVYKNKQFDTETNTEIIVRNDHWDNDKNELIYKSSFENYHKIKSDLSKIEYSIYKAYQDDLSEGNDFITKQWLRRATLSVFNRPDSEIENKRKPSDIYFTDWCSLWLENSLNKFVKKNGTTFNKLDYNNYNTCLNRFKSFEKYKKRKFRFKDLDKELKIEFKSFISEVEQYAKNTCINTLSNIQVLINFAEFEGKQFNKSWRSVNNKVNDLEDFNLVYLNNQETQKLIDLDLSGNKSYELARDIFIIGMHTGLRVNEYLKKLKIEHIKDGIITIKSKKTNKVHAIPIHKNIYDILKKHNGLPKKIPFNLFNLNLKEIAKLANLDKVVKGGVMKEIELWDKTKGSRKVFGEYPKWQLITSHTARRSFATNLYLEHNMSIDDIMELGGWSNRDVAEHYIKTLGERASNRLTEKEGYSNVNASELQEMITNSQKQV